MSARLLLTVLVLANVVTALGVVHARHRHRVLFDLGVSSPQLDVAERGFSFGKDGPLDMRMDPDQGQSAAEWLATADDREIADVLWTYGEEKQSRRIARAIVARRATQPFTRTADLAAVIASGSLSINSSRPPGPSCCSTPRAWPPRPKVPSRYVPSSFTCSPSMTCVYNTGKCSAGR